jgi:hypothetical protein
MQRTRATAKMLVTTLFNISTSFHLFAFFQELSRLDGH